MSGKVFYYYFFQQMFFLTKTFMVPHYLRISRDFWTLVIFLSLNPASIPAYFKLKTCPKNLGFYASIFGSCFRTQSYNEQNSWSQLNTPLCKASQHSSNRATEVFKTNVGLNLKEVLLFPIAKVYLVTIKPLLKHRLVETLLSRLYNGNNNNAFVKTFYIFREKLSLHLILRKKYLCICKGNEKIPFHFPTKEEIARTAF